MYCGRDPEGKSSSWCCGSLSSHTTQNTQRRENGSSFIFSSYLQSAPTTVVKGVWGVPPGDHSNMYWGRDPEGESSSWCCGSHSQQPHTKHTSQRGETRMDRASSSLLISKWPPTAVVKVFGEFLRGGHSDMYGGKDPEGERRELLWLVDFCGSPSPTHPHPTHPQQKENYERPPSILLSSLESATKQR